ncbi:MAG: hypothetical protein OXC63_00990 [Aestuariivita sp.]|nr:hypothetical protein [Aestuariivita sp.]MCY4347576.1 hypothetical protein [Aestuariivita sp.]
MAVAVAENDLDGISKRFAIKTTRIPSVIAENLRFENKRHYEAAVVPQARTDQGVLAWTDRQSTFGSRLTDRGAGQHTVTALD